MAVALREKGAAHVRTEVLAKLGWDVAGIINDAFPHHTQHRRHQDRDRNGQQEVDEGADEAGQEAGDGPVARCDWCLLILLQHVSGDRSPAHSSRLPGHRRVGATGCCRPDQGTARGDAGNHDATPCSGIR